MTLTLSLNLSTSDDVVEIIYPAIARDMLREDDGLVLQEDGSSKIIFHSLQINLLTYGRF